MKPAREPASSRPKPCPFLKNAPRILPVRLSLPIGPCKDKTDRGQTQAFPSETSRLAPLILAHRGSALPWLVDDRATLRPRRIWCVPTDRALPYSSRQCPLPLACHHLPKGTKLELGRGAHLGNTILNQTYRRHISTDRLNREDSQLTASLEGEPGPTPAGKTLPHSCPKTRFRKERARVWEQRSETAQQNEPHPRPHCLELCIHHSSTLTGPHAFGPKNIYFVPKITMKQPHDCSY